jgi:hypothetical protein
MHLKMRRFLALHCPPSALSARTPLSDVVTRSMARRVQEGTAEVSRMFESDSVQRRDADALIVSCIHSALAMVKDVSGAPERMTRRIEILKQLLSPKAPQSGELAATVCRL